MASFNAADIQGKTLTAVTDVPIRRNASDSATVVFTAKPGQVVGVVDSYVSPGEAGNTRLNWKFIDSSGRSFYAEHVDGRFSIKGIKDQGVKTTEQVTKEKERENESMMDWFERNIKTVALIVGGAIVATSVLPSLFGKKK